MKRSESFYSSEMAGKTVLVPVGKAARSCYSIITLNESGKLLWDKMEREVSEEDLLAALVDEYNVDPERAKKDLELFLNTLRSRNCLEE